MSGPTNTATVTTSDGATVTVLVEPAPPDPERLRDIGEVWTMFLVAAVAIFCLRRLLDLFRTDQHD